MENLVGDSELSLTLQINSNKGGNMTTAFLIPGEGLIVRDPRTKDPLPAEGQIKTLIGPEGRYWRRRIKDRTVTVMPMTKKQKKGGSK